MNVTKVNYVLKSELEQFLTEKHSVLPVYHTDGWYYGYGITTIDLDVEHHYLKEYLLHTQYEISTLLIIQDDDQVQNEIRSHINSVLVENLHWLQGWKDHNTILQSYANILEGIICQVSCYKTEHFTGTHWYPKDLYFKTEQDLDNNAYQGVYVPKGKSYENPKRELHANQFALLTYILHKSKGVHIKLDNDSPKDEIDYFRSLLKNLISDQMKKSEITPKVNISTLRSRFKLKRKVSADTAEQYTFPTKLFTSKSNQDTLTKLVEKLEKHLEVFPDKSKFKNEFNLLKSDYKTYFGIKV